MPRPIYNRLNGILFVTASAIGFGCLGIFGKIAYASGASPTTVLWLRFTLAGGFLAPLMFRQRLPWPRGRDLAILVLLGAIGYVGQAYCYFSALRYADAGFVTLLLYLYPALVALGAAILGRKHLSPGNIAAIAVALGGVALTVGDAFSGSWTGIGFALAAACIYSAYILAGEGVGQRVAAIPAATVIMLAAATVYAGLVLTEGVQWPGTALGWGAIIGMALLSTVIGIVCFLAGMKRLGAGDAATLSTLEPVVTLLLAALILGEGLTLKQFSGAGLILSAVVALSRSKSA